MPFSTISFQLASHVSGSEKGAATRNRSIPYSSKCGSMPRRRLPQRRRLLSQADEDYPHPHFDPEGWQAVHLAVDVDALGEGRAPECARVAVAPPVVRADYPASVQALLTRVHKQGAAVPADVGEGAQFAVRPADQGHGLAPDVQGQAVARRRQRSLGADRHPIAAEDALHFQVWKNASSRYAAKGSERASSTGSIADASTLARVRAVHPTGQLTGFLYSSTIAIASTSMTRPS